MMRDIWLIARRDFRAYFASPIAYIISAVFLFLIGYMFFNLLANFVQSAQEYMMYSRGPRPTLSERILAPLFGNINIILLFVVPFISMRLFAEERKEQTDALLFSAPITTCSIIFGKFFAALGLVLVMLAGTLFYPLILIFCSNLDIWVVVTSYLGVFLVAAAYIAIGIFCSACTENQIVAAALTFGILLFFWLIGWSAYSAGPVWSDILNHLSIVNHFTNFSDGALDSSDFVYYFSVIGLGLFGTYITFDARQWS